MKVFFDTNVWLSALVFPGLCAELLAAVDESEHELLTSELIRTQTLAVLRCNFVRHEQAVEVFELLWTGGRCIVDMDEPVKDNDARLVAAAERADADLFVTGDQRVLDWNSRNAMRIVSPRQAWGSLFN